MNYINGEEVSNEQFFAKVKEHCLKRDEKLVEVNDDDVDITMMRMCGYMSENR